MKKRNSKGTSNVDFHHNEKVQRAANILFDLALQDIDKNTTMFLSARNIEDQKDKGVDIEIEPQEAGKTFHLFKVQNKGYGKRFSPLVTTENKGLLSYPIQIRHVNYYRYELPLALLFVVCDTVDKKVYWHPIQLDDQVDERVAKALESGQDYVSIYLNPKKELSSTTIQDFLSDAHKSFIEQTHRFKDTLEHPLIQVPNGVIIDRSEHILDQLYKYISWTHGSLNHFPINLLSRQYPFKVKESYFPHYNMYRLSTDNEELIEMLKNVQITDHKKIVAEPTFFKNVDDYEKKLRFVFQKLSNNLIFELSDKQFRYCNHIHLREGDEPKSGLYHFGHLKIRTASATVLNKMATLDDSMQEAFLQYRLGNYVKAATLFKDIAKRSRKEKNYVANTICHYNLQTLGKHIGNSYWSHAEYKQLAEELMRINVDNIVTYNKNQDSPDIHAFIKERTFFNQSNLAIMKILRNIRQTCYQAKTGSNGSNSYAFELFNEFADFIQFVERNYIVYETFSEFDNIIDQFIEGVCALYSIRDSFESGMDGFNDWILYYIVFYGKAEVLQKYLKQYGITQIEYISGTSSDSFPNLVKNFLDDSEGLGKLLSEIKDGDTDNFAHKYNRYFGTIVTLIGVLDIDKNISYELVEKLIKYLRKQDILYPVSLLKLPYFITGSCDTLNLKHLKQLYTVIMTNMDIQNDSVINAICQVYHYKNAKLKLSEKEFETVKSIVQQPNFIELELRQFITSLFKVVDREEHRNWFSQFVTDKLTSQFSTGLFYNAVMFDIISPTVPLLEAYFMEVKESYSHYKFEVTEKGEKLLRYGKVDSLVNLCFKIGHSLSDKKFQKLRKLNDYYEWIFDMENFDYSKFKPFWINQYSTKFYDIELKKNQKAKDVLSNIIMQPQYKYLQDRFMKLYISP
jgi:hypothetical protein